MRAKRLLYFFFVVLFVILLSSCASMNLGNIRDDADFSPEDDERRIWKRCEEIEEVIEKSGLVYEDKELTKYLTDLANDLLPEEVKSQGFSVRVIVFKDPAFNASMFPNALMCVHTGLLANMENEAQAAIILAHELTHFINRHALKQFRGMINKTAFFQTLSAVSAVATGYHDYGRLADLFLQVAFLSSATGYSREHEYEADSEGFKMFVTKYDINEAPKAFENLKKEIEEQDLNVPYFFSTHPNVDARIKNFDKLRKIYKERGLPSATLMNKEIYDEKIKELLLDNSQLDIKMSRFKSAERGLERFRELSPNDPRGYYWLGELFRCRAEKDDKEKTLEHYQKAIDVDGNFALAHKALGLMYYKDKKKAEAIKELQAYLTLAPQAKDSGYIQKYLKDLKAEQ